MNKTNENFKDYLLKEAEEIDCWWLSDWIERKWEEFGNV
jgi:hypothetical protein